jgi:hypothetical protein
MKNSIARILSTGLAVTVLLISLSPTLGADPGSVIRPFNGRNLDGWKTRPGDGENLWLVGEAKPDTRDPKQFAIKPKGSQLINNTPAHGQSLDLYSEAVHGDAVIALEVMVPEESNSGIYVMGEYEVQVLDSYGNDAHPGPGDMGAVYGAQPPTKPKYRAPGEWNTYEIHWQAPRFDAQGKKTRNAKFLKVILNGVTIHKDLEMPGPTPGGVDGREKAEGPLMFQGNHGAVAYRNIQIREAL